MANNSIRTGSVQKSREECISWFAGGAKGKPNFSRKPTYSEIIGFLKPWWEHNSITGMIRTMVFQEEKITDEQIIGRVLKTGKFGLSSVLKADIGARRSEAKLTGPIANMIQNVFKVFPQRIKRARPQGNPLVGVARENLVMEHEKAILIQAGREDLAKNVKIISNEARGYDIHSFEVDGRKATLEVKGFGGAVLTGNEYRYGLSEESFYVVEVDEKRGRLKRSPLSAFNWRPSGQMIGRRKKNVDIPWTPVLCSSSGGNTDEHTANNRNTDEFKSSKSFGYRDGARILGSSDEIGESPFGKEAPSEEFSEISQPQNGDCSGLHDGREIQNVSGNLGGDRL